MKNQLICPGCGRPVYGNRCPRCHRFIGEDKPIISQKTELSEAPPVSAAVPPASTAEPVGTATAPPETGTIAFIDSQQKARRIVYNAEQSAHDLLAKTRSEAESKAAACMAEAE